MAPLVLSVAQSRTLPTLQETLSHLSDLAHRASAQGTHLLLTPEAFLGGYPRGSSFDSVIGSRTPSGRAEFASYALNCPDFGDVHEGAGGVYPNPGDGTKEFLESLAWDTGVFLVVGVVERCGGTLYCAVVYVCPAKGVVGKRRKLMPTASERLVWGFGSEKTLKAITTTLAGQEVTLAAAICWENYMPLLRYTIYSQNVNIYLAPTADGRESWISTMRHIAMEGRCFVLGANQYVPPVGVDGATKEDRKSCRGGSVIVGPLGEVLAGPLWDEEGMLSATVGDVGSEVLRGKMDFDVVGHYRGPWKVVKDD
ncbi:carbon-nitrogen hydrolase [Tirmania nivea]|nr:carbon-nitrogen hydrolase [Tirmania nivea]